MILPYGANLGRMEFSERTPINLSAQLIVRKAGVENAADESKKFAAIELFVTATNPSSRNVYFFANFWSALGSTMLFASCNQTGLSISHLSNTTKCIWGNRATFGQYTPDGITHGAYALHAYDPHGSRR
jgi:hypothetical protein